MSFDAIERMNWKRVIKMHSAIEIITAEKMLAQLQVHSYPHLKQDKQKKLVGDLERLATANKEQQKEPQAKNSRELFEKMMRALRGRR